jgi:hypothetical protein
MASPIAFPLPNEAVYPLVHMWDHSLIGEAATTSRLPGVRIQRNVDALLFYVKHVIELDIPGGKIESDWGN